MQGNLRFSFFRSRSKSNSRSIQKPNKNVSSKPSLSLDLVQHPTSCHGKESPASNKINEVILRSKCNTATITRRRFSSSQYDEYLKSHLDGDNSSINDVKVFELMLKNCWFALNEIFSLFFR